jgi:DNA-binding beta-propeller fold protein YncE
MRLGGLASLAWIVALTLAGTAPAARKGGLPLTTVARVPLPGASVRFDYTSIDANANRLYIAHMDANQLLVVDLHTRRIVRAIPAPGVHGVIAVPQLGRVFASATNSRQVLTIDAHTGVVTARAPGGEYPDGLAYDPDERHVFVSDESGGIETVLNGGGHRIATIQLGGEAGNVQYDNTSHHILVDVQTRNDIAVINPITNRIIRRIPLPGCDHDHGLLVDSSNRLAFVACDENARLLTLSLRTLTVIGHATVGSSPDVLALDPSLHRLYVSAESGVVAMFAENPRGLRKLGQAFLAPEAHTVAVDPRTHLVYFPLQSGSTGGPQLLVMRPTPPSDKASAFPPPGGDRLAVSAGSARPPAPWRELTTAQAPTGGQTTTRALLLSPSALMFTASSQPTSSTAATRLFWSVYCEGAANDEIFTQQGSFSSMTPLTARPSIPTGQNKCFLTVRVAAPKATRVTVTTFGY